MNPNQPSREEIEVKITALLLGELPAEEAQLLRYTISQDAELQKLQDQLQLTIGFVREVAKNPEEISAASAAPLQLSDERRQRLAAHFQTPRPRPQNPLFWLRPIPFPKVPRLIEVLAVVAILAVLAAMLLPALSKAKSRARNVTAMAAARQHALEEQMRAEDKNLASAAPATATVAPPAPAQEPAPLSALAPLPTTSDVSAEQPVASDEDIYVIKSGDTLTKIARAHSTTVKALEEANNLSSSRILAGAKLKMPVASSATVIVAAPEPVLAALPQTAEIVLPAKEVPTEVAANSPAPGTPMFGAAQAFPAQPSPSGSFAYNVNGQTDNSALLSDKPADRFYRQNFTGGNGGSGGGGGAGNRTGGEPVTALNSVNYFALNNDGTVDSPERSRRLAAAVAKNDSRDQVGDLGLAKTETSTGQAAATSAPLAWSDSDANQPAAASGPINLGEEARRSGMPGQSGSVVGVVNAFALGATATPAQKKLPEVALDTVGGEDSVDFKLKAENATPLLTGGLRDGDGWNAGNGSLKTQARKVTVLAGLAGATANGGSAPLDQTKDSFQSGLPTKDDAAGTRYLIDPATGLPVAQAPTVAEQQAYADENRRLAAMEETRKTLGLKIQANQIDAQIPTTSMVQVVDPAEPSKKQSFWQGLKGEYASSARIKVESDGGIIAGMNKPASTQFGYDPYFIQTTFEIMQSEAVLGKVVDNLKLETAWANENGGQKLTRKQAIGQLKSQLSLKPVKNTKLIEISATSDKPEEAAKIANAVAEAYKTYRVGSNQQAAAKALKVLQQEYNQQEDQIRVERAKIESLAPKNVVGPEDQPLPKPQANAPVPQPEILTRENAFSTFSLNVSDVSFKLAAASLERGQMPDAASIRSEEFINAFDYRDPEAAAGQPLAFTSERAADPFAQNRDLLRFSIKTAAAGRTAGRALNLVLLLDNSGSMERADRVAIIREALRTLATQLQPQDTISVVTFARTARLWADGVSGDKAGEALSKATTLTPEGGTNLEEAMRLAYETARRHYLANGLNRVVLLTDGAANLGDVNPAELQARVEVQRQQGIALDCFGIGFEDYNDNLLEQLSSHGDGRYAFLNSPEDVAKEFAAKLAGALQVAAADVKVQVEFNPQRVISYRQIGYAKHQLTKEQFRDNTVDAAEIAAQEAGNALYTVETKADGTGPIATVRVRYKIPGTTDYRERSWTVNYDGSAPVLAQSSAAMRLAATAAAFSEWLAASPFAQEVTLDDLSKLLHGVPQVYGADQRPQQLITMILEAKRLTGK